MRRLTTRYEFFLYPVAGCFLWFFFAFFKDNFWLGFAFFIGSIIAIIVQISQSEEVYYDDRGLCIRKSLTKKIKRIKWKEIESYWVQPVIWKTGDLAYKKIHLRTLSGRQLTVDGRWVNQIERIEELLQVAVLNQK